MSTPNTNFVSNDKQKSVCVITNGCIECRMDCAATDRFLQNTPDYRLSKNPKNANLLVFRGCAFNQEKEDLSCQIVKVFESIKRSDAQLTTENK